MSPRSATHPARFAARSARFAESTPCFAASTAHFAAYSARLAAWSALAAGACAALFSVVACAPDTVPQTRATSAESAEEIWFVNVAEESGIDFVHDSGHRERFLFPEIACGGGGLLDADGDGLLDVYLVQSGELLGDPAQRPPNRMYRNLGGLRFEDVTESAGVGDRGYGMGCAAGDFDGDGRVDLYVTNFGPNVLYRNRGDGSFEDVTQSAGVAVASWSTSAAFFDGDSDLDLDLFVANNIRWTLETEMECFADDGRRDFCGPRNYKTPAPDVLYRNEGDGTFTDVSREAGIDVASGNGLGVVCGDFDNDGDQDVYVANDGMANQLWVNRGDMTFEERGLIAGVALDAVGKPEAGMGVCAEDIEDDGDIDLFVANLRGETNTFYRNLGGNFVDATPRFGLATPSLPFTGFGVGLADFDHDGWLDLYIANGRVKLGAEAFDPADPYAEPDSLYAGGPDGRFRMVRPDGGARLALPRSGRAAAFGDLDNDGDMDVLVVNRDAPPLVLRNDRARGHWILLRILEANGADAIGARVTLEIGGRKLLREVRTAYSYLATNDPRVHVGLGTAERASAVRVRWTDGAVDDFGDLEADRIVELRRRAPREK